MNNVRQKQHQRQQQTAALTVWECLFILWSKPVVKVHATWNHLACKNPGVGQRDFKKHSEAAIRSPNTSNTIVTKARNTVHNNNRAYYFCAYSSWDQEMKFLCIESKLHHSRQLVRGSTVDINGA